MTDDMATDDLQSTCINGGDVVAPKKPRTSEDFYLFCKFILEYEKYEISEKEDDENQVGVSNQVQEEINHHQSTSSKDRQSGLNETVVEEDSYDLVTCFCKKPFAGRPMIECSTCLTWIHLRCAKVKKSEIPEIFICHNCRKVKKGDYKN